MSDPELQLEKQRAELLKRMNSVGDLRRGSITATYGKCGKPTCHCAKPGSAGHGPNYRLTRKVQGKTVTETFPSPAALKKAHIVWDDRSLEKWLTDPDAFIPGNDMDFLVSKPQERQDLISYLKQTSGE